MARKEILFDGFTEEEILALTREQVDRLILTGEPLVFRIGSATMLGEFKIVKDALRIELAQIDDGGDGVLLALGSLTRRFAALRGLTSIEWVVHAIHCANPNLKLRRVLQRRGFAIEAVEGAGDAYHYIDRLQPRPQ